MEALVGLAGIGISAAALRHESVSKSVSAWVLPRATQPRLPAQQKLAASGKREMAAGEYFASAVRSIIPTGAPADNLSPDRLFTPERYRQQPFRPLSGSQCSLAPRISSHTLRQRGQSRRD